MTWWNQNIISFLISPPPLLGSHKLNAKHYARSTCHIDLFPKKLYVCHEHIHLLLTVHSTTNKGQTTKKRCFSPSLQSWSLIFSKIFCFGLTIFEVLILQPALSQVLTKGTSVEVWFKWGASSCNMCLSGSINSLYIADKLIPPEKW